MSKKIKLLAITPNKTGVGYYRSINPHVFMDEKYSNKIEITITESIDLKDPSFGKEFDIIHFHSNVNADTQQLLSKMRQLKKEYNTKFIVDLDDYWMLPTYFPQYRAYNQQYKIHERTIELIRHADYVTTTTEIFANEIKKFNPNVAVIPNAIDPREKQFKNETVPSDRLRVGIICGSSHEKDIDLLTGLVNKLKPDMDRLQFVVCGFDLNGTVSFKDQKTGKVETRQIKPEETVWHKYEKILTDNYTTITPMYKQYLGMHAQVDYPNANNEPYRRCWTKPVNKYATHYNNIDVLLAPLVENKFNACKSQLKVIEAAFFNKAIIAQDFGPYQIDLKPYLERGGVINEDGNALLVESSKNHKQWAKYIKFLLENPDARIKMANNLSEKITKEYSLENVTKKRFELYTKIANE
jgi:glycosyltransferase involved in cell wall biosynthesis